MPGVQDPELAINGTQNGQKAENKAPIAIPDNNGPIEVPATRSLVSEAAKYIYNLSMVPSMKDRRGSRNSFGTFLPISRRQSRQLRLSLVYYLDRDPITGRPTRPSMPPI
jgi:hypothetical protein